MSRLRGAEPAAIVQEIVRTARELLRAVDFEDDVTLVIAQRDQAAPGRRDPPLPPPTGLQ